MLARLKWWLTGFVLVVAVATASPALCQSQAVRDVQERLTTFGYDPGPVDGVMGPTTRSALRSFQEKGGPLYLNSRYDSRLRRFPNLRRLLQKSQSRIWLRNLFPSQSHRPHPVSLSMQHPEEEGSTNGGWSRSA